MSNFTVFALDEAGSFNLDNNSVKGFNFVLGLLYDSPSQEDIENERNRIKGYLSWICSSANTQYPKGLHGNRINGQDYSVENKLKKSIKQTIEHFFKEGQWLSDNMYSDRQGHYHFVVSLAGKEGKTEFKDSSEYLKYDSAGTNLYTHMAEELVIRSIFHNPFFAPSNISMLIAQRSLPVDKNNTVQNKMGYRENSGTLSTSNSDTYRTVIQRELLKHKDVSPHIESLWCQKIPYDTVKNIPQNVEFIFLTDIICSYLKQKYNNDYQDEGKRIEAVYEATKKLSDQSPFVFAYCDIDTDFSNAWAALESGNYHEALSVSYDASSKKTPFTKYYNGHLFPLIQEKIKLSRNEYNLKKAIEDLNQYAFYTENLDQKKLLSLLETYYQIINFMITATSGEEVPAFSSKTKYYYYMIAQAAFNHIGDPITSFKYYDQLEQINESIPLDMLLQARRQMIVSALDSFQADTIKKYEDDTVEAYKQILLIERKYFHKNTAFFKYNLEYGMLMSQSGQTAACLRNKDAETRFIEALKQFKNSKQNYYRTLSYLLHHYIDIKNYDGYMKWSSLYFGNKRGPQTQYQWLMSQAENNNNFTFDFAFFVYIKAMYTFHFDLIEDFPDYANEIDELGISRKEHPWELINKYCALIELEKEIMHNTDHTRSEQLIHESKTALSETGFTTDAIIRFGEIEYNRRKGENCDKDIIALYRFVHQLTDETAIQDANIAYKDLKTKRFVFMYD